MDQDVEGVVIVGIEDAQLSRADIGDANGEAVFELASGAKPDWR
jgi:hypothetical protein